MRRRLKPGRPLQREQVIRSVAVTGALAALAFAVGVWALVSLVVDGNRKIDALYQSSTANRAKLVAVGQQPVGPPPAEIIGRRGPPGEAGTPGAPGAAGTTGRDGRDGQPGRDATPAQVAAAVAAYMKAHPVKDGAAGAAGSAGRDGTDGADGQSPACLAEPDQCRGHDGATGPQGPAGSDGANGSPPGAWRWTDPVTKTTFVCSRDPSTPDHAPVYGCVAEG